MSMIPNMPQKAMTAPRWDRVLGLWGRIMHRDHAAHARRLQERDLTVITACLLRLNERQLNRIGFSRSTLALDVHDLAEKARRDAELAEDILRLVEDDEDDADGPQQRHAIAAE